MRIKTAILTSFILCATAVAACPAIGDHLQQNAKASQKLPNSILQRMKAKNIDKSSPIMVRVFKEENVLEIWKQTRNGKFALISSYNICTWSGKLGPKFMEGDRQAPEGFYSVSPEQMNPNSRYYLSFNIGFPNAYDQANGRTGQHLMVHGACSSAGCYSMNDQNIAQIYAFARDAFMGGQRHFQIQALPFRMTANNMARYRNDPNYQFWAMLKRGYDMFEVSKRPPQVNFCSGNYVFVHTANNARQLTQKPCQTYFYDPSLQKRYRNYQRNEQAAFTVALHRKAHKPLPSITGQKEANLVADWTNKRALGQRVSATPPSLSIASAAVPNAPDTQVFSYEIQPSSYQAARTRELLNMTSQDFEIKPSSYQAARTREIPNMNTQAMTPQKKPL